MTDQIQPIGPGAASAEYWRTLDGSLYEEMIREREGKANRAYAQQEDFLTRFVLAEQKRLDRPLRVLEFGCGFGRHARYLAELPDVQWHGYDFSESMVTPLRKTPPPALKPLEERLFVGSNVIEAVEGRTFDLVFTVSVLIHNPPEKVADLIGSMTRLLSPGGSVCLVENQLVPLSVFENGWHQGCWLHGYPQFTPEGFDMQIGQGFVDTHDIYLLRPSGRSTQRFFRLAAPDALPTKPLSQQELDAMSVPKIRSWAQSVQPLLIGKPNAAGGTRMFELEELLRAERGAARFKRSLATLADDLATLRNRRLPAREATCHTPELQLPHPGILWDDPVDRRWAQRDARFARVVHIVHQEWHGIRASAAYSPGHKLAITSKRLLTAEEYQGVLEGLEHRLIRVVVLHGYSKTADELVHLLRTTFGTELAIHVVWLGNTAQFHLDFEYEMFRLLLEHRSQGTFDGFAMVKPGMHLLSDHLFPKTLLSLPPLLGEEPVRVRPELSGTALIPVPNDWRKNFYTNLFATRLVPRLRRALVTADFKRFPGDSRCEVIQLRHPERTQMFRIMADADVILNVTLSECQPMTALEGMALGTPCLTGPLSLGPLDDHPYQRIAQVRGVDSVAEVRDAINRLLDLREKSALELAGMMQDYSRLLCDEAIARYCEFLRL